MNYPKLSRYCSWSVLAICALTLLGWGLEVAPFKSVVPGFTAMNPLTAINFMGLAAAALLLQGTRRRAPWVKPAFVLCVMVTAAALLKLAALSAGMDFGLDRMFFADRLGENQMAPNTAINFALLGSAVMLYRSRRAFLFAAAQTCLILTSFSALLGIIGYLYSLTVMFKMGAYIPMALNTAVCFGLLCSAVYCLEPGRGLMAVLTGPHEGSYMARLILPSIVLLPPLIGGLLMLGQGRGFYEKEIGILIFIIANVTIFSGVLLLSAVKVNRLDQARKDAETDLKRSNSELERRIAERTSELELANRTLRQAQQQLVEQERLRALGEMASGIAHDFNNSLSPILGYSELMMLNEDMVKDHNKAKEYLQCIHTAAKDAAKIVGRLREFYRPLERSETFEPLDLNLLIEQTVALTQPKWKVQSLSLGVPLRVVTELGSIPTIDGSESGVREILMNLIFNAVDAMSEGGALTLKTFLRGDRVVLEVRDTGRGMTEEVRRRCLEPFFSTKGAQGSGLGLSVVYGILQRHAATLDIRTAPGTGTAFVMMFPVGKLVDRSPRVSAGVPVKSLRILYAEDEPAVREVIVKYLENDGHQVTTANHGAEGLGRFYSERFDLVITDMAMPGMSGEKMAAAIKKNSPSTPILMLLGTADHLAASVSPGSASGVQRVLHKPVTIDELRQAIAQVIK